MAAVVDFTSNDAFRLSVPLVPLTPPLTAVGPRWCFPKTIVLHTSHNEWFKSLAVKNETNHEPFAQIKHTLSAVMHVNPQMEPFAVFQVLAGKTKNLELTVRRESHSPTYEVHNGLLHGDVGPQPCLFSVDIHSPPSSTEDDSIDFRDATTGEPWQATIDGDYQNDRVAIVRVHKSKSQVDAWTAVARIHRPKPGLLQAEYFTLEIASGVDAMLVVMLWLARWGEFQRHKPQLQSHMIYSQRFCPTKQKHASHGRNPYRTRRDGPDAVPDELY
jgi:hypothetical protein